MGQKDTEFFVQRIRSQYVEREVTEIDELRALDRKVRRPAELFAYIFGAVSAIIMGGGMSLVMTEIGTALGTLAMPLGIGVGVVGMLMAVATYPLYNKILEARKAKYQSEILALSDRIIGEDK